ncbi:hypothetical protein [Lignipirellula cremea]|uniref:Uncharacterized protein n=1 Tax=Lignipirellula cremea TaxID=2528010 RepID=A0A518E3I3_9BACT|nr:hypothetical protein [Lignipirellula cremea]QDU98649.1 hypothetical protein Pla8534_65210 [Lignipirellula cremea]
MAQSQDKIVPVDRRAQDDRREKADRRQGDQAVGFEKRQGDRRKTPRRRQIDPTTCERDYTNDEIEFMQALDDYKRRSGRMFPTCSEILEVVRLLGYQRPIASDEPAEEPAAEAAVASELNEEPNLAPETTEE